MKSRTWMWMTVASLFAALAITVGMAAQDNPSQDHKPRRHQYRLIDIGTLGGPASYVSYGGVGTTFLNNSGTVAGYGDTPLPDPYAPACWDTDCFLAHGFRWQDGDVTDLGSLPGVNNSAIGGINERGWIVGASQNGVMDPITGSQTEVRAVLWKDGHIINLGTLGGYESMAIAINNRGQVAGVASNSVPDTLCFFGWGTQCRTFLWDNGVMTDLGTLGGPDSPPFGNISINESGQVAGSSFTNSSPNPITGFPTTDPFLWENGAMTDLGTLGGALGYPSSMNNRGQVVGASNLAGDLTAHPFLWDKKKGLRDLGTLGGDNGQAAWINDGGDVVGEADLPGSQVHDAFLWKHEVMIDLGNLGLNSFAFAINSEGQVVGVSHLDAAPGNRRAFLWENGGPMVDLNTLIPPHSSLTLLDAYNINERGEITGTAVPAGCQPSDSDICGHLYLLVPCDEKHPGECEDYSMIEVPTPQTSSATAQYPAAIKQRSETPISPVDRVRNQMRQRYHIPGQSSAPRD